MNMMNILFILLLILMIRNMFWWLQCWQIREYRVDRMIAYLRTEQGKKDMLCLWFYKGIFPRPTITIRILIIICIVLFLCYIRYMLASNLYEPLFAMLWGERFMFLWVFIGVQISHIYTYIIKKYLYYRASSLRDNAHNITFIALTGSYGKSTTRRLLVRILEDHYGIDNVLTPPGNINTEIGLARFMVQNKHFFMDNTIPKAFIAEVGAYKIGEIHDVCTQYLRPEYSIITAIKYQHLSLFGTKKALQKAKWELAEGTSRHLYYPKEDMSIEEIASNIPIKAHKNAVDTSTIEIIDVYMNSIIIRYDAVEMHIPITGSFYTRNLAITCALCKDLNIPIHTIKKALEQLTEDTKTLYYRQHKNGGALLYNTYNANEDGILACLSHLKICPGKKYIVFQPLLELGSEAENTHRRIFEAMKKMDITVLYYKNDYEEIAKSILQKQFIPYSNDALERILSSMDASDGILITTLRQLDIEKRVKKYESEMNV